MSYIKKYIGQGENKEVFFYDNLTDMNNLQTKFFDCLYIDRSNGKQYRWDGSIFVWLEPSAIDLSNYYDKTAINAMMSVKSDITHNHDGEYLSLIGGNLNGNLDMVSNDISSVGILSFNTILDYIKLGNTAGIQTESATFNFNRFGSGGLEIVGSNGLATTNRLITLYDDVTVTNNIISPSININTLNDFAGNGKISVGTDLTLLSGDLISAGIRTTNLKDASNNQKIAIGGNVVIASGTGLEVGAINTLNINNPSGTNMFYLDTTSIKPSQNIMSVVSGPYATVGYASGYYLSNQYSNLRQYSIKNSAENAYIIWKSGGTEQAFNGSDTYSDWGTRFVCNNDGLMTLALNSNFTATSNVLAGYYMAIKMPFEINSNFSGVNVKLGFVDDNGTERELYGIFDDVYTMRLYYFVSNTPTNVLNENVRLNNVDVFIRNTITLPTYITTT